jgi:hypothetical protein
MIDRCARSWVLGSVILSAALACGDGDPPLPQGTASGDAVADSGNLGRRFYERNFVFASLTADSVFIVPWLMQTIEEPNAVTREARAWLARGGVWDGFYNERWATAPTRAPTRLLPHLGLQLVVRDGDAIDGILYEQGARSLELVLGNANPLWTGARGDRYQVLSGTAYLVDQRIDGMILDMARASAGPLPPAGDWAFLLSGDSTHFVVAGDSEHGGETPPAYRMWGLHEERQMQWSDVRVDWERTEAFPPARRDVPVEWRVWSTDGAMEGRLEAISAEMHPGEGPGPLLPVRALFEVTGRITAGDDIYDVHGVLVHERR